MKKSLLAAAILCIASTQSIAAIFPDFQVQEGAVDGTPDAIRLADKIIGNYEEIVTFDGLGNFATSIIWNAAGFKTNDGASSVTSYLNDANGDSGGALFSAQYGLYGTLTGKGKVIVLGADSFKFVFTSADLALWTDADNDSTFLAGTPTDGMTAWVIGNTTDDDQVASGSLVVGSGNIDCTGAGINCGSFGTTTTFALTTFGEEYFIWPDMFYDLQFDAGQLNGFEVTGTQSINGTLDMTFGRIPEPSTLALLGLGLTGLGLSLRRKAA